MTIREYKPEDAEKIKKCVIELQEAEHGYQPKYWKNPADIAAEELMSAMLKQTGENGKLYIADVDGAIAGYVACAVNDIKDEPGFIAKRRCHVGELVVLKEYRGQGIAGALMSEAEKYAKEQNCGFVSLIVSTNNSAVEFYRRMGYEVTNQSMRKILK